MKKWCCCVHSGLVHTVLYVALKKPTWTMDWRVSLPMTVNGNLWRPSPCNRYMATMGSAKSRSHKIRTQRPVHCNYPTVWAARKVLQWIGHILWKSFQSVSINQEIHCQINYYSSFLVFSLCEYKNRIAAIPTVYVFHELRFWILIWLNMYR